MTRRRLAILAIACVAIGLRVWRLTWGIDDAGWFPDEALISGTASAFVPFRWVSIDVKDLTYPTLAPYLAGACAGIGHSLGLLGKMRDGAAPGALLAARVA